MPLSILGIGTAVPDARLNQEEALGIARWLCCNTPEQTTWLPAMYGGTGINTRHMCLGRPVVDDILNGTTLSGSPFLPKKSPDGSKDRGPTTGERMEVYRKEAPRLAKRAVAEALASAGRLPRDITHLVTVSCTGFEAPGFDTVLIDELGMSPDTHRTHVGFMGCHAALNGLRVANAYAGSDPDSCVLTVCVELCSLHYYYGFDPSKIVANALFADGAAAIVGVPSERAPAGSWYVAANGAHLMSEAAGAMGWTIGDHGFLMTLSKKIPEMIQANVRGWMEPWLARYGLRLSDVASWAVHPGGPKIMESVGSALGLSDDAFSASRAVLAENGNMSSATLLFVIRELQLRGAKTPCVAVGFGPGLNIEAMLLR